MTTQHLQADSVHYIRLGIMPLQPYEPKPLGCSSVPRPLPPACFVGSTRFREHRLGAIRSRQSQHQRSYPALGRLARASKKEP